MEAQEGFPTRQPGGLLGLEATRDSLRWLWESRFAAIASDAPGFERGPATGSYNDPDVSIHQWCLAGWGMPIGEMFDLEELSATCKRLGRWSFFVASVPLKVSAAVESRLIMVSVVLTLTTDPGRCCEHGKCHCDLLERAEGFCSHIKCVSLEQQRLHHRFSNQRVGDREYCRHKVEQHQYNHPHRYCHTLKIWFKLPFQIFDLLPFVFTMCSIAR